jgi:serine/threonine-protein kinase
MMAPEAELVGTLLDGRYFLRRLLGVGNFGAVYLAEQRVFGLGLRTVALKLFKSTMVTEANAGEVLNDAIVLMRLQQERTHAAVAAHLVKVLDAGVLRSGQVFVAMEYADGYPTPQGGAIRTLQGLIRAYHPVPPDLAVRWLVQVARPLAWMHTLDPPVLHCDIKPDNILPDGPSTLKLADFGLAQLAFGAVGSFTTVGAITCQPPETLAGVKPTPAADVYALGLLGYEILTGRNPLLDVGLEALADNDHGRYRQQQIEARRQGLEPPVEQRPDLRGQPRLTEILERCVRFTASERYDNAALLLRQLEGGEVSTAPRTPEPEAPEGPGPALLDAQSLRRQGRLTEALVRAREACTREPRSAPAHAQLARIQVELRDWADALGTCARGLLVAPDDAELLDLAAAAYDVGGQRGPATALRERATAARKGARR